MFAGLTFDNSYARDLEGFFVPWVGDKAPEPRILRLNEDLVRALGLDAAALREGAAAALTGGAAPEGAAPLAMVYAGHQFGGFSPRLGDGRALLLGEVIDPDGARRDIHLKGSGRTPFSRGGDGKAVLGPVLREYLMGEAMHALRIPTTRALAACTTGETIWREGPQQGAVLARVASSHLRVGTFQYFAARRETDKLWQLTDYAIQRHDPDLQGEGRVLAFLARVIARQARLIAGWMQVGFVHGVMNTDNMAISGETIDYGPCAFVDAYSERAVFSSIDHQGRYAFGNQPGIAQWNLARLAETLLPLIHEDEKTAIDLATKALQGFAPAYEACWLDGMRAKLGLSLPQPGDLALAQGLYAVLEGRDHTQFFRDLGRGAVSDPDKGLALWLGEWQARVAAEPQDPAARRAAMEAVNPVYIPRNHLVEAALVAAGEGEMDLFDRLLEALSDPFTERPGLEAYAEPAPQGFGSYQTFCGT